MRITDNMAFDDWGAEYHDERGQITHKDLDTIFIATNVDMEKLDENAIREVVRHEMIESLVRVSRKRLASGSDTYGRTLTVSEATATFLEEMWPRATSYSARAFRRTRLYFEEVHNVFSLARPIPNASNASTRRAQNTQARTFMPHTM